MVLNSTYFQHTAMHHQCTTQVNGMIERFHNELGAMRRILHTTPGIAVQHLRDKIRPTFFLDLKLKWSADRALPFAFVGNLHKYEIFDRYYTMESCVSMRQI